MYRPGRRHSVGRTALLSACALALLAGCGQAHHAPSATVAHSEDANEVHASASEHGVSIDDGMAVPAATRVARGELDFTARTIDGRGFAGSTLVGHRAVLWFWAPNCSDCVREAPHLLAAAKKNKDVEFIAVAIPGSTSDAKAAITRMGIGRLTQLVDADGSLWRRFGVVQQPAYAFVDTVGDVDVHKGGMTSTALERAIAATAA